MKKVFNKNVIINVLSIIAMIAISNSDKGACSLLFYEPKRPEMLTKVTKEELFIK